MDARDDADDSPRTEPSSQERAADPGSAFPAGGEHVEEGDSQAALEAMPGGNATTADMVDTDDVDSSAHDG
ncbi:hypothetical protein [uncultured Nocardioides sp.]|uniref:hypothetical protein n=1 Tax=uncultured Nocardioides sp. TaxID=198441 RepID=UPI0025D8EBFD|nr:hypothetical protein [uncultured Nocardioides sp.]